MLTAEERREIESEAANYLERRSACIDALRIVQRHRGWVSDEGLRDVADFFEMTLDELDAVATFYSLIYRKPVGRHVILLCDSVSCWVMGYEKIRKHLNERLGIDFGGTTPDQRFTLLPVPCLGTCDRAPAMMVDEHLHRDLDPGEIDRILEGYK
jgi:NADH-quinone oxidoreductase subunit E